MKHEQIPTNRPNLKITLRFNPLEVGEEARAKRVHRQDTEREDANMHESAVYHRAVSSHFFLKRILEGLSKGVAASGFLLPRGASRRKIGNRSHQGLSSNINYALRASNGTRVLNKEHCRYSIGHDFSCTFQLLDLASSRQLFASAIRFAGWLAFRSLIGYHQIFVAIETTRCL
jgi:hypothetical protein